MQLSSIESSQNNRGEKQKFASRTSNFSPDNYFGKFALMKNMAMPVGSLSAASRLPIG
jgi:hypothetical protein